MVINMYKCEIESKKINIYCESSNKVLPLVIINSYDSDGLEIWETCKKNGCFDFILVNISNLDWNNDLSITEFKLFKDNFGGKALNYLDFLTNKVIPSIQEIVRSKLNKEILYITIGGYSLAGLFSLYACFNSDIFKRVFSISGSLWYPGIKDYVLSHKISENVDKIYLSLGDKEAIVKNEVLNKVEDNTNIIYNYLSKNINTIYELNSGNHFYDSVNRIVKGIMEIIK